MDSKPDTRIRNGSVPFTSHNPYTVVLPEGFNFDRAWPLVMALHGMGHSEDLMRRYMGSMLDRPWIWAFPRGPYPFEMRQPERIRIGHAWYLFTGDQDQLRTSMKTSTQYLLDLHDLIRKDYPVSETLLAGFSQGGYLAGYVAPHHPERFRGAASIGGRLKWEFMDDVPGSARKSVALAQFHGAKDENVSPTLAREAADQCRAHGFEDVVYSEDPDAGHEVSPRLAAELSLWLERLLT